MAENETEGLRRLLPRSETGWIVAFVGGLPFSLLLAIPWAGYYVVRGFMGKE